MIYSVRGELIAKDLSLAVIECGGVGYACRVTLPTLSSLPDIGKEARLLTYLYVREDDIELFGFSTEQEMSCFKMLLSVSGVGPKAAIAILSDTSPEKMALAIASGDSKAFTKTKGVGPKLAQRIVLELKDKVTKEQAVGGLEKLDYTPVLAGTNSSEAIAALVVLGYSQSEAAPIIAALDPNMSVEDMIKTALKKIGMKF